VVVGRDYTYGARRTGTVATLREAAAARGGAVAVLEPVTVGGVVASSSRIREYILEGRVGAAQALLGRAFDLGSLAPNADTLSVSSDKIAFNGTEAVIQGNTLTDSADSHYLSFENSGCSLDASLADADVAAINYTVYFYPKGVTNNIQPNNEVKIDNTKNLIVIWSSNGGYTAVFAQTDTSS
jgi:hypothetical protein